MAMLVSSGHLWTLKLAAERAGKVEDVCIDTVSPIGLGDETDDCVGAVREELKVTRQFMSDYTNISCSTARKGHNQLYILRFRSRRHLFMLTS